MKTKIMTFLFLLLMLISVQAISFTDAADFVNANANTETITFATTTSVGVGGATFTSVQNGTFFAPQTPTHAALAAQGAVFGADASDLPNGTGGNFLSPQVPSGDNGTAIQAFPGTDGIFVSDFGPVSDTITAFLVDPTTANGLVTAGVGSALGGRVVTSGNATLFAFDSQGNLVESVTRNGTGFLGISSNTSLAAAVFFFDTQNGSALDSFQFAATAVPEPTTILSFLLCGLLIFTVKRKK